MVDNGKTNSVVHPAFCLNYELWSCARINGTKCVEECFGGALRRRSWFLENAAGAVVGVAGVLQQRIDGHGALAAVAGLLAAAASGAQHDGGAGGGVAARGALAGAIAGGKRHLLAEVTGHFICLVSFLVCEQFFD